MSSLGCDSSLIPNTLKKKLEDLAGGAGLARTARQSLRDLFARGGEEAIRNHTAILDHLPPEGSIEERIGRLTARDLGAGVKADDPWCLGLLGAAADYVAAGLAELLSQGWGEERIILGGSIAIHVGGFIDRIRLGLTERQRLPQAAPGLTAFDPAHQLVLAGLGEERGILGAVLLTDLH